MGKGEKKADRKRDKEQKREARAREHAATAFSLVQAAALLGPADPALEAALRAAYPDGALASEGALVAHEHALEDGERLCSQALWLLESDDEELREAARRAGLGRPLLSLAVDALLRLEACWPDVPAPERAAGQGRALRREALGRLGLARQADAALAAALLPLRERPSGAEALAAQLEALAAAVRSLPERSAAAQALAASKGLDAREAEALAQAAAAVRQACAGGERLVLDPLAGLALVLLGDLLRSLRAAARRSRKAPEPAVRALAAYFAERLNPASNAAADPWAGKVPRRLPAARGRPRLRSSTDGGVVSGLRT